jgi:RNA polymerase sigma-70 factor (ECF subfamily)
LQSSDLELAKAASKGDAQAFDALVARYAGDMFRLALSLSASRADAEDICQEAFVGAFRGVHGFDGRSSFKTWLTRILLRQAAKIWKKGRRRNSISIDAAASGEPWSNGRQQNALELQAPVKDLDTNLDLLDVIRQLGPDHQQVVLLREVHGMSYDEIALSLGIPRGTVESRLFRARAELRKLLKDYEP